MSCLFRLVKLEQALEHKIKDLPPMHPILCSRYLPSSARTNAVFITPKHNT